MDACLKPLGEKRKWLYEGLTYRLGDVAIGGSVGFVGALFFTHDLGDALGFASLVGVIENALNTAWYLLNRAVWHKVPDTDHWEKV